MFLTILTQVLCKNFEMSLQLKKKKLLHISESTNVLTSWPWCSDLAVGRPTETKREQQALTEQLLTLMHNYRGHQINELDFTEYLL